jgi:hypothetical protein
VLTASAINSNAPSLGYAAQQPHEYLVYPDCVFFQHMPRKKAQKKSYFFWPLR